MYENIPALRRTETGLYEPCTLAIVESGPCDDSDTGWSVLDRYGDNRPIPMIGDWVEIKGWGEMDGEGCEVGPFIIPESSMDIVERIWDLQTKRQRLLAAEEAYYGVDSVGNAPCEMYILMERLEDAYDAFGAPEADELLKLERIHCPTA